MVYGFQIALQVTPAFDLLAYTSVSNGDLSEFLSGIYIRDVHFYPRDIVTLQGHHYSIAVMGICTRVDDYTFDPSE